jgi:SET domain-containing protein
MLHSAIEVRRKGTIHGNGLFATRLISKGELVWELTDPTYSWKEIEGWDEERRKAFDWYGFQCVVDRFSSPEGNSREMNHSCDSNTWWAGSDSIVARRDIHADEEVTYDYSICDIDLVFEMECHCGSPRCRGKITNRDYLNPEWQEQYGLNLPPHVLAAIEIARRYDSLYADGD